LPAVRELRCSRGEAVARMARPAADRRVAWEAAFQPQLSFGWRTGTPGAVAGAYMPTGYDSVLLAGELPEEFWTPARFTPEDDGGRARTDVSVIGTEASWCRSSARSRCTGRCRGRRAAAGSPGCRPGSGAAPRARPWW
ncbi:hypothetical protein, partial [Streptomyces roseochromogenus]|uniref:hypothetical protein n=1 Tax=Streptomyces roseochromogenus TaxID=285450 RepID=UPI0004CF54E9